MERQNIRDLSFEELADFLKKHAQPSYRTGQIASFLYEKDVSDVSEITNIPESLKQLLSEHYYITLPTVREKFVSREDGTVKYLFDLWDGQSVETVVMRYSHGFSVCLSTQVGCRMGCSFCASTKAGFIRNLTPGEMLGQLSAVRRDLGIKISNVVLMGIGEPLDNFDSVLRFLATLSSPKGMQLSLRHLSLSTCGLVDKIRLLQNYKQGLTLSVSLHAPFDTLRNELMPINRKYPISVLLAACKDYSEATGRRISLEYALIDGVNDSDECAVRLAEITRGLNCHINIIPVNTIKEKAYRSSKRTKAFADLLLKRGRSVTVRRRLGADIAAACGQLRASKNISRTEDSV